LDSIKVVKPDLIKGRRVLLLDDVKTSGNSLIACKELLLKAGAKEVVMVALGRTTH
jgi:predicted amidophosphoribosyltransferase